MKARRGEWLEIKWPLSGWNQPTTGIRFARQMHVARWRVENTPTDLLQEFSLYRVLGGGLPFLASNKSSSKQATSNKQSPTSQAHHSRRSLNLGGRYPYVRAPDPQKLGPKFS